MAENERGGWQRGERQRLIGALMVASGTGESKRKIRPIRE